MSEIFLLLIWTFLFIIGLVLLVKGSDYFVKSSAAIAKILGVSEFLIGLTLVAIGTSLPEMASSIMAAAQNETGLVVGNITGSNIANIGLIIGIAASIHYIKTKEVMVARDGLIMLFASVIFYVMILLFGEITFWEGIILLVLYVMYILFIIHYRDEIKHIAHFTDYVKYIMTFKYVNTIYTLAQDRKERRKTVRNNVDEKAERITMAKHILVILVSITAIIGGSYLVVEGALTFSNYFDIPSTIVGITLIALGTSLPELSVCIAAARKGYGEIILGNVIGSNISNVFLVGGIAALINPLSVDVEVQGFIAPFMVILSVILLIFVWSGWKIERWEGIVFLGIYAGFIVFVFLLS